MISLHSVKNEAWVGWVLGARPALLVLPWQQTISRVVFFRATKAGRSWGHRGKILHSNCFPERSINTISCSDIRFMFFLASKVIRVAFLVSCFISLVILLSPAQSELGIP